MPPLTPQQVFNLVYQLGNPGDTGTYYVQAIVRYSATGAVIATLNMTNAGNQRFTSSFTVPADVSGNGYYIDITYSVYSDAGYSVYSQMYPIENVVAQVLQNVTVGMGIGGGSDSLSEIELWKILEKFFGKPKSEISSPNGEVREISEKFDWSPILGEFENIHEHIDGLPKKINIDPLMQGIQHSHELIKQLPPPQEQKEVDLYPVLEGLQNIATEFGEIKKEIESIREEHSGVKELVDKLMDSSIKSIKKTLLDSLKSATFTIPMSLTPKEEKEEPVEEVEEKPKYDLSKIVPKPYVKRK